MLNYRNAPIGNPTGTISASSGLASASNPRPNVKLSGVGIKRPSGGVEFSQVPQDPNKLTDDQRKRLKPNVAPGAPPLSSAYGSVGTLPGSAGTARPSGAVPRTLPGFTPGPFTPGSYSSSSPAAPPPSLSDAPLSLRLKKVLDALRVDRRRFSSKELSACAGLPNIDADTELLQTLYSHSQISYDALNGTFTYRPRIPGISNRQHLIQYLNQHTTSEGTGQLGMVGVKFSSIEDSYLAVKDDVQELLKQSRIFLIGNLAAQDAVLFANQPLFVDDSEIRAVKEDILELFHTTTLPRESLELQRACIDANLKSWLKDKPPPPPLPEREEKKRAKAKRRINLQTVTNAHLPELFANH